MMRDYTLFIEYGTNGVYKPYGFKAESEEEACRTASVLADFIYQNRAEPVLIRVVGSYEDGRPVGEIRRPISN